MITKEFIEKKKKGIEHTQEEIQQFIQDYVNGQIPDYQVAAWLMAVNFQNMTKNEIIALTEVMLYSGETLDIKGVDRFMVDKHSTGGVGDKVSLILAPLAQSAGCVIPMISGRGLGHTGGTLDKLESIPDFNVDLSKADFNQLINKYGLAMGGQTKDLVPADSKLYSLRDVTATVKSIPLITASILSKKIAEGIDGLVLDVKTGSGAFLPELRDSQKLANTLKEVGEEFGIEVKVMLTDMNQPLGKAVGNWLEVKECLEVMEGRGPKDLKELTLDLSAWMVVLSGIKKNFIKAKDTLKHKLDSGAAKDRFIQMVENQGGDSSFIKDPKKYEEAEYIQKVKADKSGYVNSIDTYQIGMVGVELGAGRLELDQEIYPEVGLIVDKKIGDKVEEDETICRLHARDKKSLSKAKKQIKEAFRIEKRETESPPIVYETL